MYSIKTSLFCTRLVLLTGLVLASVSAAAGQCKGMPQDACAATAECTWVNGYVRKDGRSVSSHCKTKARKRSDDQASTGTLKLTRTR